ncbi:MAG: HDOD domain-containing protein [Gallionella sp.]|jgi:putative nucleotidyltransferase with HDIG domain
MISDRAILDKLHQLPAMPQVVQEVLASFRNARAGSAVLARQIAQDQGLSARVLRVANSSFYGLPREIGSIQDAITVLGFDSVRSLVVSAGFMGTFPSGQDGNFDRQAYWLRSFRVATYTESLAKCLRGGRELAFTAGMFHEVGQLVLSICIPEMYAAVLAQHKASGGELIQIERTALGFDHAGIGAEMARRWNFPPEIEQAIHYWRDPLHEPFGTVTGLVHVAAMLESGLRDDALISSLPERLLSRLNISAEGVNACLPQADQLDAVAKLMLAA